MGVGVLGGHPGEMFYSYLKHGLECRRARGPANISSFTKRKSNSSFARSLRGLKSTMDVKAHCKVKSALSLYEIGWLLMAAQF